MIRIAIETATAVGSVAVGRGDAVLAEVTLGAQRRHAEMAVPALDEALRRAGVDRADVGAVVVGAGPGSFTGVRVAGATAKGLAAALDVPLVAYSSLLGPAVAERSEGAVCTLFDARRGEVYGGCWRVGAGALDRLLAPRVGPAAEVVAAVAEHDPLFVGDGVTRYADALRAAGVRFSAEPVSPRASSLLWLAEHHGSEGAVEDASAWEPDYVRASSAERGVPG